MTSGIPQPLQAPFELPAERHRARQLWLSEVHSLSARIGVPEKAAEVISVLEAGRPFRRLFDDWERLSLRHRRKRWEELCRATEKAAYATRPFCLRCGECCRTHTPVLHRPDLELVREGVIGLSELVTLRRGERAWSPLKGQAVVLAEEMVKVRQLPSGGGPCYDPATRSCRIYERRPLQCRALKCWEPEGFERLVRAPRLKRRDVLPSGPLAELVARSEREVDCALALRLLKHSGPGERAQAAQIIDHDARLREQALGLGAAPADLDFLLGRPLGETLKDLLR
jgi:Fe-S-cluster containining protein